MTDNTVEEKVKLTWRQKSQLAAQLKAGVTDKPSYTMGGSNAKRRRVKSMGTAFQLNNMVINATGSTLLRFKIEKNSDGGYDDPYTWPSLNLAPDMGPDEVALDHYLAYGASLNVNADYDMSHLLKNLGKCTLKNVGLWKNTVLYCTATNVVYGSTLSPPRMVQIRETLQEYFRLESQTDGYFQMHLPILVQQLPLDVDITDPECAEAHIS